MKKIIIKVPQSIEENYIALFDENSYFEPIISVHQFKNAFVTFNGIVIKNYFCIQNESIYQYPNQVKAFKKKGIEQVVHSLFLRKVPFTILHFTSFTIHQPWMNFYHWLLESLPRLIQMRKFWNSHKLILPKSIADLPYVRETLDLFPELSIHIPIHDNLWVKNLAFPNLRPECHLYNASLLQETRAEILSRISNTQTDLPKKIFVIRRKAAFRTIENLEEVTEILAKFNFQIIDFEDYSLTQQIHLVHYAEEIIAQHGAGLSHLLFAQPNTKVYELHKKITNPKDHLSRVYWYLADIMNLNYDCLFCEPVDKNEDFFKASIRVDINLLEKLLENKK